MKTLKPTRAVTYRRYGIPALILEGKWLLRDILNLKERELLTYEKLQTIGLDAVVVYKIDSEHYDIDFTRIGSYEKFEIENGEGGIEEEAEAEEADEE